MNINSLEKMTTPHLLRLLPRCTVLFVMVPFLFLFSDLSAQSKVEIKTGFFELIGFRFESINGSGELLFAEKWGIELGLEIDFSDYNIRDYSIPFSSGKDFENTWLYPVFNGKFFVWQRGSYRGLYIGPTCRVNIRSHLEESGLEYAEQLSMDWIREGIHSIDYGAIAGYKALFFSHFVLEASGALTKKSLRNLEDSFEWQRAPSLKIELKVGYRF